MCAEEKYSGKFQKPKNQNYPESTNMGSLDAKLLTIIRTSKGHCYYIRISIMVNEIILKNGEIYNFATRAWFHKKTSEPKLQKSELQGLSSCESKASQYYK